MSELLDKQKRFAHLLARLIDYAYLNGYELTVGDAYRDPRVFGNVGEKKGYGRDKSNHKIRLAMDFNLFKDGQWMKYTEDFKELGEYWESLAPDCRWGGRFNDGNHFSLEFQGRR